MVTFYRFLTQSVAILLNKLVCLHLYLDNTDGLIPKGFAVTLKTLTVFKNLACSLHCNTLVLGDVCVFGVRVYVVMRLCMLVHPLVLYTM